MQRLYSRGSRGELPSFGRFRAPGPRVSLHSRADCTQVPAETDSLSEPPPPITFPAKVLVLPGARKKKTAKRKRGVLMTCRSREISTVSMRKEQQTPTFKPFSSLITSWSVRRGGSEDVSVLFSWRPQSHGWRKRPELSILILLLVRQGMGYLSLRRREIRGISVHRHHPTTPIAANVEIP